jgi:Fe-S-cluster containining protein
MTRIPSFTCREGCHECCGIVPFSTDERNRVAVSRPLEQWEPFVDSSWVPAAALSSFKCPFVGKDGCSIYELRPMVCRLFGAVDHPMMKCPMGSAPEKLLTDAQSRELLRGAA